MLRAWEREDPGRTERIFDAMARVVPSHLMDRNLFPFAGIEPTGVPDPDGDRAFDGNNEPAESSMEEVRVDTIAVSLPMRGGRPPRGDPS
jgi:tRNA 2-thiocytidine biosynthesis protein TtcA